MSIFNVNIKAINPQKTELKTPLIKVLVDTGSELTWLPKDILLQTEIKPVRKRNFKTATKKIIQRDVGYAILQVDDFETIDEVVFAEDSDMNLLGVRTIEGFGVVVDNIGHRFITQASLVV